AVRSVAGQPLFPAVFRPAAAAPRAPAAGPPVPAPVSRSLASPADLPAQPCYGGAATGAPPACESSPRVLPAARESPAAAGTVALRAPLRARYCPLPAGTAGFGTAIRPGPYIPGP